MPDSSLKIVHAKISEKTLAPTAATIKVSGPETPAVIQAASAAFYPPGTPKRAIPFEAPTSIAFTKADTDRLEAEVKKMIASGEAHRIRILEVGDEPDRWGLIGEPVQKMLKTRDDLLEAAWTIIASGDWGTESAEWNHRAEKFRVKYHALIGSRPTNDPDQENTDGS